MRFFRQILFAICAILALCGIVVPLVGCGASRTSAARYHDRALLYLHTTPAYEAAVLNLLSNQTSLTVKKLKLAQPLPVPIVTNYYSILSPPMGIGGMILTTNYAFEFQKGHLSSLGKRNWLPMTNGIPEPRAYNEFFHRPSLVTSNGAYQLATQWLGALSVDVAALEQKNPPHIRREPADEMNADGTSSTNWFPGPLFQISWGTNEPPFSWANPIWIRLIGSTKEPLSVTIRDTSFFISPPMVLTNAGELLGPLPLPRKFVTDLFGGEAAYQVVANPARVEVALIEDKGVKNDPPEFVIRKGPVVLKSRDARKFSALLASFDTYLWQVNKMCSPNYGVRIRFIRPGKKLDVYLCFGCEILLVRTPDGWKEENFDLGRPALVELLKQLFPKDEEIKKLSTQKVDWKHIGF